MIDGRTTGLALKRAIDATVSALMLVLIAPILLAMALVMLAYQGRPVLYAQVRPGLHGRPFVLWKFRTMSIVEDTEGRPLPDSERLTGFGRFLRTTSLDELPELWNVIRGDMSLVGPRPLLMEYLPLYSPRQRRRHEMRPGITGWAQVNGRNAITWEEKFELDVWYIDNWSIKLDFKILALTVVRVLCASGISQRGHATSGRFEGNIR